MPGLEEYLKDLRRHKNNGRCLHFDAGGRCTAIVNAHTIQKGNLLGLIAEEGHVVRIESSFSDLKKGGRGFVPSRVGINRASTFLGFCEKHDNELFEAIDNLPFLPCKPQALLYAYRALCKEYFLKENAVAIFRKHSLRSDLTPDQFRMTQGLFIGSDAAFKRLRFHKERYDESVKAQRWDDIRYVSLNVSGRPTVLVSGAIFPDFDFQGNVLQDLSDLESLLSVLTFFTAPSKTGWSFVFAWHSSSDAVCRELKSSLATYVHDEKCLDDVLFRCIFSWSENHAMNPTWWNSLSVPVQQAICERARYMADLGAPIRNDYLRYGLEGVSGWEVASVQDES